jgi:H+/gluconate symporter-like permease
MTFLVSADVQQCVTIDNNLHCHMACTLMCTCLTASSFLVVGKMKGIPGMEGIKMFTVEDACSAEAW